jgi:hypothetical protein
MEILSELLNKRTKFESDRKRALLNAIKQNLEAYSGKHISIRDCIAKTGVFTTDLILYHNSDAKVPDNIYDQILVMAANYYTMIYIDMYTGFYTVRKDYVNNQVSSLTEDVINEVKKSGVLKTNNLNLVVHTSRDFTTELIEIYYMSGTEGCLRYLISSIHSLLQSVNRKNTIDKKRIKDIMLTIRAERTLSFG